MKKKIKDGKFINITLIFLLNRNKFLAPKKTILSSIISSCIIKNMNFWDYSNKKWLKKESWKSRINLTIKSIKIKKSKSLLETSFVKYAIREMTTIIIEWFFVNFVMFLFIKNVLELKKYLKNLFVNNAMFSDRMGNI